MAQISTDEHTILQAVVDGAKNRRIYLWLQADAPSDCAILAQLPLRAIWSERGDFGLVKDLTENLPANNSGIAKQITKIPTVIGKDFSFDTLLPIVFTRGENFAYKGIDELQLTRGQRVERERQLEEANYMTTSGIVLIAGGEDLDLWTKSLREELLNRDDPVFPDISELTVILLGAPESKEAVKQLELALEGRQNGTLFYHGNYKKLVEFSIDYQHSGTADDGCRLRIKIDNIVTTINIEDLLSGGTKALDECYYVITADDFEEPSPSEREETFKKMISKSSPVWKGFQAGFPFKRIMYKPVSKPQKSASFSEREWERMKTQSFYELTKSLLYKSAKQKKNFTITLPAEPGSGSTTMVRDVAFHCAQDGFPTLVAKESLHNVDYWQLTHFLTELWRKVDRQKTLETSTLLVFDEEHMAAQGIENIAKFLENDGRNAVVIRVISAQPTGNVERDLTTAIGQNIVCNTLQNQVGRSEASKLYRHLRTILKTINSRLMPNKSSWERYLQVTKEQNDKSYFWVCLQFFIFERLENIGESGIQDTISQYLCERLREMFEEDVKNDTPNTKMMVLLAVTTCFRVPLPFMILNQILGLNYPAFLQAEKLVEERLKYISIEWSDMRQDEIEISLNHSLFAELIIRIFSDTVFERAFSDDDLHFLLDGAGRPIDRRYPVEWLKPILERLDHEQSTHQAYAEKIAVKVLKLELRNRIYSRELVKQMLTSFSFYPEPMIKNSATILQAKAITTSKSCITVGDLPGSDDPKFKEEVCDIRGRFLKAEADMELAIELVMSAEQEKTEDPRILKTTLANIYVAWSKFEKKQGNIDEFNNKAIEAGKLYLSVMSDWPDSAHARYGLANLYLSEIDDDSEPNTKHVEKLEQALAVLDIEPDQSFLDQWVALRANIIRRLDSDRYKGYIDTLISQGYEIGFIMKARCLLPTGAQGASGDVVLDEAIELLELAEKAVHKVTKQESRSYFLYQCLSQHSRHRWNFPRRYDLLSELEAEEFRMAVPLIYEYAVLCYQMNREEDGDRQFNRLRKGRRYMDLQVEEFEYWLEMSATISEQSPGRRATNMRVVSVDYYGGWAEVQGFKRRIPFSQRHPWGATLNKGSKVACWVRFYKAGPRAVPQESRDGKESRNA